MFQKNFFKKGESIEVIIEVIKKEGFAPLLFTDEPKYIYSLHQHPATKLLVCLEGSMEVEVNSEKFKFEAGDKLIIPGNTPHSAVVGDKGCIFFWSEKVI